MELEIDYSVCKANDLIQRASYDLSASEQKFLLYVVSKIKPSDRKLQTYDFPMVDLLEVFGIDEGGNNRGNFIDAIRKVVSKTLHIQTDKEDIICGWFDTVKISRGKNQTVTVRVNEELRPYLLELSERFTVYQLRNVMAMKSKYSIRLYELAKSHAYKGGFMIGLDDFRRLLRCEGYTWGNIRDRILSTALQEINTLSDLKIGYTPIRAGHAYTDLKFTVNQKGTPENLTAQTRQEMILYGW